LEKEKKAARDKLVGTAGGEHRHFLLRKRKEKDSAGGDDQKNAEMEHLGGGGEKGRENRKRSMGGQRLQKLMKRKKGFFLKDKRGKPTGRKGKKESDVNESGTIGLQEKTADAQARGEGNYGGKAMKKGKSLKFTAT